MKQTLSLLIVLMLAPLCHAQMDLTLTKDIEQIESKVISWRHYFHENPELSNREFKTAEKIAEHLRSLGMDVQTGVGKTGVVAILKGDILGKW